MKKIWLPQVLAVVLLAGALLFDNPYGYYILLRWICCAVFIFLAVRAIQAQVTEWAWVLGVLAGLYNPLIKVPLGRDLWELVNAATLLILAATLIWKPIRAPRSD